MSVEQSHPATGADGDGQRDTLPVLAQEATIVHDHRFSGELSRGRNAAAIPAMQAAAVAAGGFVAGAAVAGLVTRRQRRSAAVARGRGDRKSVV